MHYCTSENKSPLFATLCWRAGMIDAPQNAYSFSSPA